MRDGHRGGVGEVLWEARPDEEKKVFTYREEEIQQWPKEVQERFFSLSYPNKEGKREREEGRGERGERGREVQWEIKH